MFQVFLAFNCKQSVLFFFFFFKYSAFLKNTNLLNYIKNNFLLRPSYDKYAEVLVS